MTELQRSESSTSNRWKLIAVLLSGILMGEGLVVFGGRFTKRSAPDTSSTSEEGGVGEGSVDLSDAGALSRRGKRLSPNGVFQNGVDGGRPDSGSPPTDSSKPGQASATAPPMANRSLSEAAVAVGLLPPVPFPVSTSAGAQPTSPARACTLPDDPVPFLLLPNLDSDGQGQVALGPRGNGFQPEVAVLWSPQSPQSVEQAAALSELRDLFRKVHFDLILEGKPPPTNADFPEQLDNIRRVLACGDDSRKVLMSKFCLTGLPATIIVAKDGTVSDVLGFWDASQLREYLYQSGLVSRPGKPPPPAPGR